MDAAQVSQMSRYEVDEVARNDLQHCTVRFNGIESSEADAVRGSHRVMKELTPQLCEDAESLISPRPTEESLLIIQGQDLPRRENLPHSPCR